MSIIFTQSEIANLQKRNTVNITKTFHDRESASQISQMSGSNQA